MAKVTSDYPGPFQRAWLGPRFWPVWLGLGLFYLYSQLPRAWRHGPARLIGRFIATRNQKRLQIVLTNLEWCFPELSDAVRRARALDYFALYAQSILDIGQLWWASEARLSHQLRLVGAEQLEAAFAAHGGAILLTSHNVALEQGATALTRCFPSLGLIKQARNPLIDWFIARGRTRFKGVIFPREKGLRTIVRGLRSGHAFYYLPDEDFGPEQSVFVPFFGVQTATITALSRLARLGRVPVLPFSTHYDAEQGCYVAEVGPALEAFPGEDETEDAARMRQVLEGMIRAAPAQYMWSLRIFRSRPDGSPPPYAMKGKAGSGHRARPDEGC